MANLFTGQTPANGDNSDATPGITSGMTVRFSVPGIVTGVRFYSTVTVGGTYTGELWTVEASDPGTGSPLAAETLAVAPSSATWNTIAFDPPVAVAANTPYRVGLFNSEGRYVNTPNFFTTDLTNGDIAADADGDAVGGFTISQGVFRINATVGYPNSTFNSNCYFVDVEFEPVVAETGTAALALPAMTAAAAGTVTASGTSAVTLPALQAAAAGTASASGVAALPLPALAATASGTASVSGAAVLLLPAFTASAEGGPSAPATATAVIALPGLKAAVQVAVMAAAAVYPDAETRIMGWLRDHLPPHPSGVKLKVWADPRLPQDWPFNAPIGHIQRSPGEADAALTLDIALIDVDWYSKNADHARWAAEQTRALIRLLLPHHTWPDGVTVSGTSTVTAPFWGPDPSVFRRSATYRIVLHGMV